LRLPTLSVLALAQFPAVHETAPVRTVVTDFLEKAELFRGLDHASFQATLKSAILRSVPAGATLFKQGDEPDYLFVVNDGRFKMTTVSQGRAKDFGI
jgi:hypothetical protein